MCDCCDSPPHALHRMVTSGSWLWPTMKPLLQGPRPKARVSPGRTSIPTLWKTYVEAYVTDSYTHLLVILYIEHVNSCHWSKSLSSILEPLQMSDWKPSNFDPSHQCFPIFEDLRQSPSKPIISALRSRQMLEAILLRLAERTPCKHNAFKYAFIILYMIHMPLMPPCYCAAYRVRRQKPLGSAWIRKIKWPGTEKALTASRTSVVLDGAKAVLWRHRWAVTVLLDPSDLSTFYGPCISAWISWLADLVLQDPSYPTQGLPEEKKLNTWKAPATPEATHHRNLIYGEAYLDASCLGRTNSL